jgi:DNA-binding LacI/PurR family transcriptional regulator
MVLINRDDQIAGPIAISVDNAEAAREALDMLHRCGCRRVAVVSSTAGTPSLVAREHGFVAAAGELAIGRSLSGRARLATLPASRRGALLSASGRPDAAFCVTDLLACRFVDAARREFGLDVPADLCVVGFDDIEQAGWAPYDLTTFRQPIDAMADHITTLIADARTHEAGSRRFRAVPVWRRSVRPR